LGPSISPFELVANPSDSSLIFTELSSSAGENIELKGNFDGFSTMPNGVFAMAFDLIFDISRPQSAHSLESFDLSKISFAEFYLFDQIGTRAETVRIPSASIEVSPVPEPGTLGLVAFAISALCFFANRSKVALI
jgi:hypothetical protein